MSGWAGAVAAPAVWEEIARWRDADDADKQHILKACRHAARNCSARGRWLEPDAGAAEPLC